MTEREIFTAALNQKNPAEQAAFLDEACAGDAQLRQRVESLLTEHQELGSFMDAPSPGVTTDGSSTELPGAVIGPYKLLEQIGEGGMGVVFMAEQHEPVRRRVALKLIKPGMDTRQIIARFEAERQALAVMDHPSIARVLDAGATESGRPYFVMELVRGVPITTYCDENNLPVRERLELFASVCQAIQHAHTKGIIHRDIKPTNVLVTRQDGRPVVKVIDFGVAKAMGQQLTEKTLFTNFAQMIGTPLYMSPEQAEQSGVDIDTRSDIFSLGVLLYELLTGSTPVNEEQMKKAAFDEVRRIICEDEPQTPSARISGSHTLPAIAAHRHIEPARLSKLVRGELDWIVMKALDKDRGRRYETANAFAADLLHYLNDEPVHACPPSATYRFGKFARRNRVGITTASLVALALVLGTIVSTWQAIRAETARAAEAEQVKIAEAARSAEAEQRKVAEAERSEAEKQREQAEANFQNARKAVDEYFTLVSESTLLDVPGLQPLRKELLGAAQRFYKKTAVERKNDPGALADLAVTYLRVAQVDHAVGRNDDCAAAIANALDVVDRLRSDYPGAREHYRRVAGFWKGYRPGRTRTEAPKDPRAALKTLERAIKTWQELADEDPEHPGFQSDQASMCYLTGRLLEGLNERESLRYFEQSKTLLEKLVVDQPNAPQHRADLARTYQSMVAQLSRAGRPAEAEAAQSRSLSLREALVTESPNFPQYRGELALILSERAGAIAKQQPAEADKMFQRAIDLSLGLVREFPEVVIYYEVLALNLKDWARYVLADGSPEQKEQFERTVHDLIAQAADGSMGAIVRLIREQLVFARRDVAKAGLGDPEKLHLRSLVDLDELAKVFPKEPKYVEMAGHSYRYLGWITRDAGRPDDAIDNFDKGVAAFQKLVDTKNPAKDAYYRRYLIDTLLQKVDILAGAGRAEDAEKTSRQVLEMYESLAREYPKDVELRQKAALAVSGLVALLTKSGRQEEVAEVYRQAIARLEERVDDPQVRIYRGTLHRDSGEVDKAIADFSWVIAKDPKLAEAWDLRGNCYLRKGEFATAVEDYSEAIKLKPREGWYWHERAYAHLVLGQHEKAIADHSQVIRLSDHDPGTRQRRGDSYRALGEWEKAEQDYTRAIELQSGLWEAWHNRGLVYVQLKQDDKALNDFVKAAELYPKDADFLNNLAWGFATSVDATARNPGLAVELAKLAQRAFRSILAGERIGSINATAFAHWNVTRGTVDLLGNGLFDIYPGNGLYVDLDGSTGSAGRLESKALFTLPAGTYELRFALGNTGGSPNSVRVTLASLFDETFERTETAPLETISRTISVTDPTSANLVFDHGGGDNFGLVIDNVKLTNQDSGTILLDDNFTFAGAVELHPKNLDFLNTLGAAHYRARNWKDSIEALEKCMELHAPNESYGSFFLAMAHWQLGNKDEARKSYAKAVEWMDKHAPANEELKRFRAEAEALLEVSEQKGQ